MTAEEANGSCWKLVCFILRLGLQSGIWAGLMEQSPPPPPMWSTLWYFVRGTRLWVLSVTRCRFPVGKHTEWAVKLVGGRGVLKEMRPRFWECGFERKAGRRDAGAVVACFLASAWCAVLSGKGETASKKEGHNRRKFEWPTL